MKSIKLTPAQIEVLTYVVKTEISSFKADESEGEDLKQLNSILPKLTVKPGKSRSAK